MTARLIRTAIIAVALLVTALLVPDIVVEWSEQAEGIAVTLLILALVFGLVNGFIRPIARLVSIPLNIATLGLFSVVLNAGLLLRGLIKQRVFTWQPGWNVYIVRLLGATAAMAIVVLLMDQDTQAWLDWSWSTRAIQIAMVCGAGIGAYLVAHLVAGTRMRDLRAPGAV